MKPITVAIMCPGCRVKSTVELDEEARLHRDLIAMYEGELIPMLCNACAKKAGICPEKKEIIS